MSVLKTTTLSSHTINPQPANQPYFPLTTTQHKVLQLLNAHLRRAAMSTQGFSSDSFCRGAAQPWKTLTTHV